VGNNGRFCRRAKDRELLRFPGFAADPLDSNTHKKIFSVGEDVLFYFLILQNIARIKNNNATTYLNNDYNTNLRIKKEKRKKKK
jgi:hypothetical protein